MTSNPIEIEKSKGGRSIKGYCALISIVISLVAMMFGTFVPLIVSTTIIALFVVSKKINVSRKVLGYFVLFLIVGSLFTFGAMPFIQKGMTGKTIDGDLMLVDEPMSQDEIVEQPASEESDSGSHESQTESSSNLAKEVLIEDQNQNAISASIVSDEDKKTLTVTPENSVIKQIEFNDLIDNGKNTLRMSTMSGEVSIQEEAFENKFVQSYSIDPTELNFTNATVTVQAKGSELYKCKDWNFTTQTCFGSWNLLKSGLTPGQDYTFTLTADDPGFGEINATDAHHLDSNYGFISDIFAEIEHQDGNWSEKIYHDEYVRVIFAENLTNGSVIDLYARGPSSEDTWFEIYPENASSPLLGTSRMFNSIGQLDLIILVNVTTPADTFDFKIVNNASNASAYLEFDYVHDELINGTCSAVICTDKAGTVACTCVQVNAADNVYAGGVALDCKDLSCSVNSTHNASIPDGAAIDSAEAVIEWGTLNGGNVTISVFKNSTQTWHVVNNTNYIETVTEAQFTYNLSQWINTTEDARESRILFFIEDVGPDAKLSYDYVTVNMGYTTGPIDSTAPTISIVSPINGTIYNNATQLVNITSDGDNIWFNNGTANITYVPGTY
ncbi:MAG: hypothetical protein KKE23_03500, partial [Nanoarchaeota archaeon]|nr:hypothetical protein [Nanoarchaeota archaeon]